MEVKTANPNHDLGQHKDIRDIQAESRLVRVQKAPAVYWSPSPSPKPNFTQASARR